MDDRPDQKLLTKGHHLLAASLAVAVFLLMSLLLRPFTFSPQPVIAQLQASLAALPIACVFWFACNMFMVVLVDQRRRSSRRPKTIDNS